ncbi:CPBP family intramembrane glutamic endopeptidase [Antrihabitans sp. NCIMB 15449]|uniref:CPBP family intramembrane glutamic endopeptidase n=1 Tax=Antrihabitans spumae TaxID=3373370 RepID=A0ABW7JH52_9NOCA
MTNDVQAAAPTLPDPDIPYYNGIPQVITGKQWWLVMAAIVAGFAVVSFWGLGGAWGHWVPVIALPLIPLLALRYVAPEHWTAIFRRVSLRDVLLMLGIWILNVVVTVVVGWVLVKLVGAKDNPGADALADATMTEKVLFMVQAVPQLFGEELLTILPLLALMYYFHSRLQWSRRTAMLTAWLVTALIFGAVHLPTYDWNVVQAVVGIGVVRLILTLGFLITKNIWVSTGAHILNDWTIFGFALN